ncbi:MAG: class I SAM-dependent methyltransferase [gamma proteobacterium symbiont of Bathyaustriella thionipta]|nr:class I SAM-dependent methyltransferase [gamma proteobacterium symbiont of Bathyaustriella thionipta]
MSIHAIKLGQQYDDIASAYAEQFDTSSIKPLLKRFDSHLPEESQILDIGCGPGVPITRYLADKWHMLTAIDCSNEMIRLAQKKIPNVICLYEDMYQLDFPDDCFDGVVASGSLFHEPLQQQAGLLRRIRSVMHEGGVLLVSFVSRHMSGQKRYSGEMECFGHKIQCAS